MSREKWKRAKFGRVARIGNGADCSAVEVEDGGYPVFGSGGEFRRASEYLFDGESVLFGRKGTVDRPMYVTGRFWTVDTMFYSIIDQEKLVPKFAYYWATTLPYKAWATDTAIPSMTSTAIKSAYINLPSNSEQRAIADYLDRETAQIDAFIAKNEELISLLTERRTAAIARSTHTEVAQARGAQITSGVTALGSVPTGWAVQRLKSTISSSRNGVWGEEPDGGIDDIRCVRVADFDRVTQRIHDMNPTKRRVTANERRGRVLKNGDLLLEKSGGGEKSPVGFVVLYDREEPAVCSNFVARVELAQDMDPRYWTYSNGALYGGRVTERSTKQSTGIQNLDQSSYFSEYVAVPPLTQQIRIADHLDRVTSKIDAAISTATHAIELARERRSVLISAAVTGKIDVGVAA